MGERSNVEDLEQDQTQNNQTDNLDAERLAATNARLLRESQEYKAKYKTLAQEIEEMKSKEAEKSGDLSAQLELERKKAQQALAELGKTKKKVIGQAVKEKIARYAGDIYSLDDLVAGPELKDYLKEGLDEDNLDFNDEVAKRYIEEVKKKKPYLWKSVGSIAANTSRPGSGMNNMTVDTTTMSATELKEYIKKTFK
jgi:hypothetical protein